MICESNLAKIAKRLPIIEMRCAFNRFVYATGWRK